MHKRKYRAGLAAIGAIALLAAACGSDDSNNGNAAADNAAVDDATVDDGAAEEATEVDGPDEVEIDQAALQALLDGWRREVDVFGATLSVRVPGHDDIHLASGVDDRVPETPMPTDGTYDVFSVTKSFTAAAALQLVDEGRLSLDEPVEPWLPELPNADQITLAMLLGHTSGLGSWTGGPGEGSDDYEKTLIEDLTRSFTPEELVTKHLEQPPTGQPGGGFAYRNANYDAVGLLIERELDQELATVFEEMFAVPLALDDTFLSDGSTQPTRHGWFSFDGDPDRPVDYLDAPSEAVMTSLWAAAGMISSSADLLDWGEALYSGELLGEETTATMIERQLGIDGSEFGLVGKGGGAPWREVLVTHHRDSGTTIVIQANSEVMSSDQLAGNVIRQLGLT